MKKLIALFALLLPLGSFAQQAAPKSFWDDPFNSPDLPYYATLTFVGIVFILLVLVMIVLIRTVNLLIQQIEKQRAAAAGLEYVPAPSWWDKLTQKLNASVPIEEEKSVELDHNYDGIRELDNHLPPWWKWLFYVTIIWSAVYLFAYHLSYSLPLSGAEYEAEVANAQKQKDLYLASQPQAVIDEASLVYSKDGAIIAKGKDVFVKNGCASCHGNEGGGNNIGPNITDEYWIHGGGIKNVFATIKNGVVEKGMPAWGKVMSPSDVRDVAFFVLSLQGTKPANAKAPQGELYKAEPAAKPDSTKTATTPVTK